ncbi:MAG: DUF362 domain-containing protein [Pseudomonadota bacterium]
MNTLDHFSKSRIAIVKCGDYQVDKVYEAVKESVDLLGGMGAFIGDGDRVLLKPNLLSGKPQERAVTTHPSVVFAAARLVKEAGGVPYIGDSPGIGNLRRVAEKTGMKKVADDMGIELMEFSEIVDVENKRGHVFKRFEIAKAFFEVDAVINLPKLKTHSQMVLTLGVKNNFGLVVGNRKAAWHLKAGLDVNFFAQMLVDLYLLIQPKLTVVDGITGMEGDGPGSGDPIDIGLIFTGIDCVALDVVISQVLGVDPDKVFTTRIAKQRGIGKTCLKDIDVLGERLEEIKVRGFKLPKIHDIGFRLPRFLSNLIKDLVTLKPAIDHTKCGSCQVCIDSCPPQTMRMVDGKITIDYRSCIRCFCCQELCPDGAVKIKKSWLSSLPSF